MPAFKKRLTILHWPQRWSCLVYVKALVSIPPHKVGMVVHVYNPSTQEAKAGGSKSFLAI